MRTMRRLAFAFTLAAAFGSVGPAWACPNCKEAAASAIDDGDDPFREARAYNHSIYFMLAVPFTLVGLGSLYCYRHLRQQGEPHVPNAD